MRFFVILITISVLVHFGIVFNLITFLGLTVPMFIAVSQDILELIVKIKEIRQ